MLDDWKMSNFKLEKSSKQHHPATGDAEETVPFLVAKGIYV